MVVEQLPSWHQILLFIFDTHVILGINKGVFESQAMLYNCLRTTAL